MKINKRALLVEGILLYEIILNYLLLPIDTLGIIDAPPIVKILLNTLIYGGIFTLVAIVFIVMIFYGIQSLFKWINEDQEDET